MATSRKLLGKTVVVTGSGRGIGRATAILFARHGADLVLLSRTKSELLEVEELCRAEGVQVFSDTVDLADTGHIDQLFSALRDLKIGVDILINNAAIFSSYPVDTLPLDEFRHLLEINLVAPLYLSQKAIPLMKERGGGVIVNISSLSGCFGTEKFPGFGAYNISKYGLWGLTEILALENRRHGIRVNQLSLAGVDTAMYRQAAPPGDSAPLTPEDVADRILYLASDDSEPLTGKNVIMTEPPETKLPDD